MSEVLRNGCSTLFTDVRVLRLEGLQSTVRTLESSGLCTVLKAGRSDSHTPN